MLIDTTIRFAYTTDIPFIINSWANTIHDIYPNYYVFDFQSKYRTYLKSLIEKSTTIVAVDTLDDNEIISFLVYTSFNNKLVIHFAYTKVDARNTGKLTSLISFANIINTSIIFTHPAKNENRMKHFTSKYIYDPSLLLLLLDNK